MGTDIVAGYEKRLMLAAGRSSKELGAKIASRLRVEPVDAGLKTFSDGEVYRRYSESIRGADLFIVQSICGSLRERLTVNDALMELLLMVHAASCTPPPTGSSRSRRGTGTPARTRSQRPASRSPLGLWPSCWKSPESTGWSRWTCTPDRCRASSRRPLIT